MFSNESNPKVPIYNIATGIGVECLSVSLTVLIAHIYTKEAEIGSHSITFIICMSIRY